ncbi:hypothetical protein EYF80_041480 [Liparis tanakae]|uniref:Uncharacterized protein n=1 Tax=Liparis tanakae TaxID=230148 RepID=A0A4Z2G465_9TELE|nr:hypothetical protein EYF80_041480 [Liparis tanakae]
MGPGETARRDAAGGGTPIPKAFMRNICLFIYPVAHEVSLSSSSACVRAAEEGSAGLSLDAQNSAVSFFLQCQLAGSQWEHFETAFSRETKHLHTYNRQRVLSAPEAQR